MSVILFTYILFCKKIDDNIERDLYTYIQYIDINIYIIIYTRYIIRKTKNKTAKTPFALSPTKKHKGLPWLPWLLWVTFLGYRKYRKVKRVKH